MSVGTYPGVGSTLALEDDDEEEPSPEDDEEDVIPSPLEDDELPDEVWTAPSAPASSDEAR